MDICEKNVCIIMDRSNVGRQTEVKSMYVKSITIIIRVQL